MDDISASRSWRAEPMAASAASTSFVMTPAGQASIQGRSGTGTASAPALSAAEVYRAAFAQWLLAALSESPELALGVSVNPDAVLDPATPLDPARLLDSVSAIDPVTSLDPVRTLDSATGPLGWMAGAQTGPGSVPVWTTQWLAQVWGLHDGTPGTTAAMEGATTETAAGSAGPVGIRSTQAEAQPLAPTDHRSTLEGTPPAALVTLETAGGDADFEPYIQAASTAFRVPAQLIRSVIDQESSGNPNAVSATGAVGLMQLSPSTARELGVTNPLDPEQNIWAGTKYLAQLAQEFGGNWALALAAYNAGPQAVRQYGGIPPFPETQRYVQRVLTQSGLATGPAEPSVPTRA